MKITKEEIEKLLTEEQVETCKKAICQLSMETERDDGDLFTLFWEGINAYKDQTKEEVVEGICQSMEEPTKESFEELLEEWTKLVED